MTRVALLGTGLLGSGFADALLSRGGTELHVWNRTRAKADLLGQKGAKVFDDAAEAVRGVERVHLILLDDDTVDATIDALRPGLDAHAVICDHTTTQPSRTAERAQRLAASGVAYLHCPVFMSPAAARGGQGIIMVAGDRGHFERVKDALTMMTGDLWFVGERTDLAAAYKLFGNAMILTMGAGLADIFHMSDALEVSRAEALALFSRFKPDAILPVRGAKIVEENFVASFALEVARKDARLMLDAAGAQPVPVIRAIAERMDALIAQGLGDQDVAVLAKRGV